MNRHGNYTLHLGSMKDLIVPYKGEEYVFCSVIAQRLKVLDSTLYRRWFQLCQFTLDIKAVYGIPALNINPGSQVKKGHSSSLTVAVSTDNGKDYITE